MDLSKQVVQIPLGTGSNISGFMVTPVKRPAPAVLLIHEWWGLNDEMKALAERIAGEGFLALACDLFQGEVAGEPVRAKDLMMGLDPAMAGATLIAWVDWLRKNPHCSGKVAALGFCMGGAWALNVSLLAPLDATVIYYGNVAKTAEQLSALRGPVLGHFGKLDQSIPQSMAEQFSSALKNAGKKGEVHLYDANHAFSRAGGPNYHEASASLAWRRSVDFLRSSLC